MTDVDLAFRRNQPRWPKGHPLGGQWRGKAGLAKRLLKAGPTLEAQAEAFYDSLEKPGAEFEADFGFGPMRVKRRGFGDWEVHKKMPSGEWMKSAQFIPDQMLQAFLKQDTRFRGTKAYQKFIGVDPDRFLKRRVVDSLPAGYKQVTPDEAYEPEVASMLWDPSNVEMLLFQNRHKDVVRILADDRFTDDEIRAYLANAEKALDYAAGVSPAIRRKPVDIVVHDVWDSLTVLGYPGASDADVDGIKGFVRPIIPDMVNINPSTLKSTDETNWSGYWEALNQQGHFVHQAETVHPQVYFLLHELGHIADSRDGHTSLTPHGHTNTGEIHPREGIWHADNVETPGAWASLYGRGNAAEGYAEAFAQWALLQKDGPQNPLWWDDDLAFDRGERDHALDMLEARADFNRAWAAKYADRYGWTGGAVTPGKRAL